MLVCFKISKDIKSIVWHLAAEKQPLLYTYVQNYFIPLSTGLEFTKIRYQSLYTRNICAHPEGKRCLFLKISYRNQLSILFKALPKLIDWTLSKVFSNLVKSVSISHFFGILMAENLETRDLSNKYILLTTLFQGMC